MSEPLFEIDHGGKRLEFDVDIVERVLSNIAALRDHDDQGFADVADLVPGERNLGSLVEDDAGNWWRGDEERAGLPVVAEVVGDIGGDHTGPLQRSRNIDLQDAPVGYLAAQERGVQHAWQFDVIDEQRLAGKQPAVLVAPDRLAEGAGGHDGQPRIRIAAVITASTMFW